MKDKSILFPSIHNPRWVTHRSRALARELGLSCRTWFKSNDLEWVVLQNKKAPQAGQPRVYLSAGIHGDEAGSVLGLLNWMEQSADWLKEIHFTVIPCLNPWGLRQNSRLDEAQRDLNRCYFREEVPSTAAHRILLAKSGPFDLAIMLHEDYDAPGMYIYEVMSEGESWGHDLLKAAKDVIPSDDRPRIEGRAADRGVVQRNLKSLNWKKRFEAIGLPEAVYVYLHHCPRVYTFETPSEFALHRRAKSHVLAINAALKKLG